MQRFQSLIYWTVLVSETTHVFCCVLPIVISILSLLSGLGILSVLPSGLLAFHDMMHHWEIPLIITSACILAFGWALHIISIQIDCHNTGCHHEPCKPKKRKTSKILIIASALFLMNVSVYTLVHM